MKEHILCICTLCALFSCDRHPSFTIDNYHYYTFIVQNELETDILLRAFLKGTSNEIRIEAGKDYQYWQEVLQEGFMEKGKIQLWAVDTLEIIPSGQAIYKLYSALKDTDDPTQFLFDYWIESKNEDVLTMTINQEMLDKINHNDNP